MSAPRPGGTEGPRSVSETSVRHSLVYTTAGGRMLGGIACLLLLAMTLGGLIKGLHPHPGARTRDTTSALQPREAVPPNPRPAAGLVDNVPPLGDLEPASGLLPSGTLTITLSLTTTAPADCRWSSQSGTNYRDMPYVFEQGQGTVQHSTIVSGIHDSDDRWFYVRCEDISTGRDPDNYERRTHLRVLGPWNSGYPRIANLWGFFDPEAGAEFFAGYDLFIPYRWHNPSEQAAAIRANNPNAKILLYQYATKGRPETDPLTREWWNSEPGDPGYNCLLRNSDGEILLVKGWGHPMYNMTVPYCRTLVAERNIEVFLSSDPDKGANLAYDGIYWDLLYGYISWLSDDIDSDLDGQPDDPDLLNAKYQAGIQDFLERVRARLPYIILAGNESPKAYAPWINGRLYEWQIRDILDGKDRPKWSSVVADYRDWVNVAQEPHVTFIQSAPDVKAYSHRHFDTMPKAMQEEVAASYDRMRFGLASALMGDGLFSYDFGATEHGQLWWYDEFGSQGNRPHPTLPRPGYLGQPSGDPIQLGEMGVWARQFQNGIAIVNTTRQVQRVTLPDTYCKLNGSQAPLFQIRLDDDQAMVSAGWSQQAASSDQFGGTVQIAMAGSHATITYTPTLAYSGTYEVLAWVVPKPEQSSAVSVTVYHAQGQTTVSLDETVGEIGWHSLGYYVFEAGNRGSATLAASGNGTVVADAFKWVSVARYNDGRPVSQVTLQPLDGIVLLSTCQRPVWPAYLPLIMRE